MLASVIRRCWLALCRDILALGYRVSDMFTTLTFGEMVAIVVGANPNTSVRWFLDGGWSREAHMMANMVETQQGIATRREPFQRPGIDYRMPDPANKAMQADAYTWSEFDELERKKYSEEGQAQARAGRSGKKIL